MTIGDLLKDRYLALEIELKKYINCDLLPSLDTLDLADVCFLLSNTFHGIDTDEQYTSKIHELIEFNRVIIVDNQLDYVVKIVTDFVKYFKSL